MDAITGRCTEDRSESFSGNSCFKVDKCGRVLLLEASHLHFRLKCVNNNKWIQTSIWVPTDGAIEKVYLEMLGQKGESGDL